jgi:small conductance mechanosensitive channel
MPTMDLVTEYVIRYGFQVLGAVLVFSVGALVARWAGKVAQQWLERQDMEPPVRMLLVKIIQVLIMVFTAMAALGQLGVQIAPLLAGIGVAGLGLGLALQGVLSNVIAGLSIIFTKPYRVGEHISLLGVQGDVRTIDLFSTTLQHPDRSLVIIPNRKIVGEILHNFSNIRQLHLSVNVAYTTNLTEALALVRSILSSNPGVLKDPAPAVGISQLGESGITLSIDPWVSVVDFARVQGELNQAFVERFQSARIQIPYPQREVRMLSTA